MRVALVHDWLTGMRGGERCLDVLCELYPNAPIYTLFYVEASVSELINQHQIFPSFLNGIPFSGHIYRYLLPSFSWAIQSFDFRAFDLVVSSSHCVAKGIRVPNGTCHISYIHTPMRYIWDGYDQYFSDLHPLHPQRLGMSLIQNRMQRWDKESNAGIYAMIANSKNVARRIQQLYGKKAQVVHPPVDWQKFQTSDFDEGFYLMVTALVPYKRVDLAIKAMNYLGLPLKIIGTGSEIRRLRKMAGPSVEFLGWQSDNEVCKYYQACRGVLFPGEEDFGIVPLEAMASGKPVIAYGKGGALETIIPLNPNYQHKEFVAENPTGVFFYDQTVEALIEAIQLFERKTREFHAEAIRAHVKPFDRRNFKRKMGELIGQIVNDFNGASSC